MTEVQAAWCDDLGLLLSSFNATENPVPLY